MTFTISTDISSFIKLSALLVVLILSPVYSQQSTDSTRVEYLDEVVVSDSKFALKREQSGKTIISISAEELQRQKGRSLLDILNTAGGIELSGSRGRPGEIIGVFARGGRGRQVVILIDGVRVTDPSSFSQEYDLRLLNMADIASIEIIKGAASTLYGANAATAVISITTKKAAEKPIAGYFQSQLGTQQPSNRQRYNISSVQNQAMVSGSLNRWFYRLSFSHDFSNGLSSVAGENPEVDPNSVIGAMVTTGYRLGSGSEVSLYAETRKLKTAYDEGFGLVDAPYEYRSDQKRIGTSGKLSYANGSLNLNAALSFYDSENFSAFPNRFNGENLVVDFYNKLIVDKRLHTVIGVNYLREQAALEPEAAYSLLDPYLNMVYTAKSGLNINTGLRLNTHSEYGNNWVYALNPSYGMQLGDYDLKFLASYATAYITPSLTQLFGQFGANPGLEPESDRTIEGGMEVSKGSTIRASFVYFNRREENFVFFDNETFTYNNAQNTINARGFEIEAYWQPSADLSVQGNYTYTDRSGDNAIRIPKHKFNSAISFKVSETLDMRLDYSLTGARMDTDFNTFEDVELEAFGLVGLMVSKDLPGENASIYLRLDNLFNTDYTEVIGFSTRGRNIALGLQLRL